MGFKWEDVAELVGGVAGWYWWDKFKGSRNA